MERRGSGEWILGMDITLPPTQIGIIQLKTGFERLASYVTTKGFRAEIKRDEGVRKSHNQRNSGPLTLRSVPILQSPASYTRAGNTLENFLELYQSIRARVEQRKTIFSARRYVEFLNSTNSATGIQHLAFCIPYAVGNLMEAKVTVRQFTPSANLVQRYKSRVIKMVMFVYCYR